MIDVKGIKNRTDIVAVVGSYVPLVKRGGEYVGLCVAHADKSPSMWVQPRKQFIHCFACGFNADVIEFVMHMEQCDFKTACEKLGATDTWKPAISDVPRVAIPDRVTGKPPAGTPAPDMSTRALGAPSRMWCYRDSDGLPLGYVARYDAPEGKEVRCWTWGARGDEPAAWGCGHWNRLRPLYGLDRLAARPEAPVLVVEGEKAADAATALLPAYVVVTWPGGALAYDRAEWIALKGRSVLLWPDADAAGVEAMTRLAGILSDPAGLACTVSVLDVSGQPEGSDAADLEAAGLTTADVIAWAKPRKRALAQPQPAPQAPAPMPEPPPPPAPVLSLPIAEQQATVVVDRGVPSVVHLLPPDEEPPPEEPPWMEPGRPRRHLTVIGGTDGAAARKLDPEPVPAALSDDALGDYFAVQYGETLKHVPERSSSDTPAWLEWDGQGWRLDVLRGYFSKAIDVTRRAIYWPDAMAMSPSTRRAINSAGKAKALLQVAGADKRVAMRADVWDANPWLLGIPGGSIDLETGDLREAVKTDYITKRTSVAPARGAHPLFDAVLVRATGGDEKMLGYLWRWFGYMLTGDTREECFLFLHGPGGSGKSTLTSVLTEILGDYAVTAKMETFAETKQQKHAEELARLDGARMVLTSETDEGHRWNESRIKWLTGRNKITANYMRANSFEFTPQFKLLIEGNHRPGLKSVGEEMRRRIHLVEYAGSIPEGERDKALKVKLRREYPAILHSMVEGCLEWCQHGLEPPTAIQTYVEEYLEAEDTLGSWLEECCELVADAPIMPSAAYKSFREWANAHGEYCPSQKRFSQKLQDRGFRKKRSSSGMLFYGLRIKLQAVSLPADW